MRGRIDDRPARLNDSAGSKTSGLQAALPHDMENGLPAGDKIISDYAATADQARSLGRNFERSNFCPTITAYAKHERTAIGVIVACNAGRQ
jgi:hypothetical protein